MSVLAFILCVAISLYVLNYLIIGLYVRFRIHKLRKSESGRKNLENTPSESVVLHNRGGVFIRICRWLLGIIDGWVMFRVKRLGYFPSHIYRDFILRHVYMMDLGKNAIIYHGFEIRSPWRVHIGEGTIIGDNAILDGRMGLEIGRNVNFSTGVSIWTLEHDLNDPFFACNEKGGTVRIGDRAWVSTRTIVLPRVQIGEGSVIAAGAVVTKDCDEYTVYGGIPARKIGVRNRNLQYQFDGKYVPFW
ncbi:MAG: acyltransferase [Synergistaceae bacterium]|nr:acyltransferase [Synergistaceae bacterium]